PEEAQVDPGEERVRLEDVLEEEIVRRNGDRLDHDDRDPEPRRRRDALRDREERAHAEEEREREALDGDRLHEETEVVLNGSLSPPARVSSCAAPRSRAR